MTGVGTHAKACQLRVNLGATGLGVFVLFEHQHACTFAQHKTVTVLVPGARSCLGVVVARGKRTHGSKAAHPRGDTVASVPPATTMSASPYSIMRPASPMQCRPVVQAVTIDRFGPLKPNRMDTCPATILMMEAGTKNGVMRRGPRAASSAWVFSISGRPPIPEPITQAMRVVFGQGFACGQACVQNGLLRSRDAVMNEGIHGARILGAHVFLHIKSLDLTCNLAREVRRIELGDEVNAGLAGQKIGPGVSNRVTHGEMQPRPVTTTRRRLMRSNL